MSHQINRYKPAMGKRGFMSVRDKGLKRVPFVGPVCLHEREKVVSPKNMFPKSWVS